MLTELQTSICARNHNILIPLYIASNLLHTSGLVIWPSWFPEALVVWLEIKVTRNSVFHINLAEVFLKSFCVVDTGRMSECASALHASEQKSNSVKEHHLVLFIVDKKPRLSGSIWQCGAAVSGVDGSGSCLIR